jgi:hypothetical protein
MYVHVVRSKFPLCVLHVNKLIHLCADSGSSGKLYGVCFASHELWQVADSNEKRLFERMSQHLSKLKESVNAQQEAVAHTSTFNRGRGHSMNDFSHPRQCVHARSYTLSGFLCVYPSLQWTYGADLRPLSSGPAPTSALPVAVASAFLAAAASAPVPPSPVSECTSSSALGVAVGALPPIAVSPSPYVSTSSLAKAAQASQHTANDSVDNVDNRSLVDSSSSDNSCAFPPRVGVSVGAASASGSTAPLPKVPVKYGGIPQDGMCV